MTPTNVNGSVNWRTIVVWVTLLAAMITIAYAGSAGKVSDDVFRVHCADQDRTTDMLQQDMREIKTDIKEILRRMPKE